MAPLVRRSWSPRGHTPVLKQRTRWYLRTELLPPYAPELNPIEYLWGYLKFNPLANLPCMDLDFLADSARQATRSVQTDQDLLLSFIRHSPLSLRLI